MSNKTNFKRIALVVVSALGFGVIAAGPSNATIQAGSTLTIASSTATAIAGAETATAVLTMTYTSTGSDLDSMIVTAVRTAGATPGVTPGFRIPGGVSAPTADSSNALKIVTSTSVAYVDAVQASAVSGTVRFDVIKPTTAGTYTYTFYPSFTGTLASGAVAPAPVSWTLTVTAANTKPAAAQSSIYIGQPEAFAIGAGGANGSALPNMGDSTINVTAGTVAGGAQKVAAIGWIQRTSDSSTTLLVPESVTAVITGAGLLSVNASSARAGAVTAGAHETITVWSDARGGVGTITLTTTSMTTWATKTVTFFGTAASATLSARFGTVSKTGIDSATALQVSIKDALAANFTQASYPMYVHSSDTKVVSNGACSGFVSVSASTGLGACSLSGLIVDSGTAKIKVANYAAESTTAQAAAGFVTGEVTIKVVGAPKTVKATFDKATYSPGDEATVTLTFTDGLGNVVDSHTSLSGALAAGLDYNVGTDMTDTIITFGAGVKTYTYVMPSSGQKVVLSYKGGAGLAGTQTADSVTVTVIDPAEEAANSALDAAQEATDAAIAATDAAILAQEAADEAASAAIAAQETAQAAVDAVTALSAEVTKLVAQLATVQKLLTRVAKKVGLKI